MKDKFVLDSSVWIEIHRGNSSVIDEISPFIERNEVCLVDLIIAEILRGVKTEGDYNRLKAAFDDFTCITTEWDRVANLAFRVGRRHFQPPLTDLYIAQSVWENNKTLITHDRHFLQIAKVQPFELRHL